MLKYLCFGYGFYGYTFVMTYLCRTGLTSLFLHRFQELEHKSYEEWLWELGFS